MTLAVLVTLVALNIIPGAQAGCNVMWPSSSTESDVLFYITPTANSPNPDCSRTDDEHCVTLDGFTKHELPNIKAQVGITLIFSKDIHISNMSINFTNFQRVNLCGNQASTINGSITKQTEYPLIRLLSGNITVSSIKEPALSFEMVHLAINGSGQYALVVMNQVDNVGNISLNQVKMFDIIFQVVNDFTCPIITISDASFLASMIELYGCMINGSTSIINSNFSSGQQPYTIALCDPVPISDSDLGRSRNASMESNSAVLRTIILDKVSVFDLNDPLPIPQLPFLCSLSSRKIKCHPTDIYVGAKHLTLKIMHSYFSHSYGTAVQPQYPFLTFMVTNSTFTGYTQGVLVFNGDLRNVTINLIDTILANNSRSSGQTINSAIGFSVIPNNDHFLRTLLVKVSGCSFVGNVDTVGNLQVVKLHGVTSINISNTNFTNNDGTAIDADQSNITFSGNVTFHGNRAWQAGALSLKETTMTIAENASIVFSSNHATHVGGAIFIENPIFYLQNDKSSVLTFCFYQPMYSNYEFGNAMVSFFDNSAKEGGDHIYGTSIRNYCRVYFQDNIPQTTNWTSHFDIDRSNKSISHISSKPMRVCLCDSDGKYPLCNDSSKIFSVYNRTVYPGEEFSISLAVVGAEFGATVGGVYAKLLNALSASLPNSQQFNLIQNSHQCTQLKYSINSSCTNSSEILYLTSDNVILKDYGDTNEISNSINDYQNSEVIPYSLLTTPVFINITLSPCPLGFTLVGNSYCDCYPELKQHSVRCLFKNGTGYVIRKNSDWVGVQKNRTKGVIFDSYCPLDYCSQDEVHLNLEAEEGSDAQCMFHHAGTLCGRCKEGYSITIGSDHCLNCTTNNNVTLLLFFAAAGPLLYVVISALDLTITKGTINGLIFYANIVWVYQNIIFTSSSDNANKTALFEAINYFKVFIAWLNLDFGIELCFIKGLDAFWKSLLQYVFPIYLWFIAWLVIVAYSRIPIHEFQKRYPRLARIAGKPVDVLATFIFLSYTKLLRTIVAAFSFAVLQNYPHNKIDKVWAIDGNIPYLGGKHIVVFILALLSLIITLVYTLYILVVGLQSCEYGCRSDATCAESGNLIRWFKHRLDMPLPVRDSLFLPLKDKHRYWFGLLLLVRSILLVIFSVTYMINARLNLLILLITASILLIYMGWKRVYNRELVWILQALSLGNLIYLSGGILYIKQPIIVYVSIGMAFIQFIGIISYHIVHICMAKQPTTMPDQADPPVLPTTERENLHQSEEEPQNANGFRESILLGDESDPLINTRLVPSERKIALPCLYCCREQQ